MSKTNRRNNKKNNRNNYNKNKNTNTGINSKNDNKVVDTADNKDTDAEDTKIEEVIAANKAEEITTDKATAKTHENNTDIGIDNNTENKKDKNKDKNKDNKADSIQCDDAKTEIPELCHKAMHERAPHKVIKGILGAFLIIALSVVSYLYYLTYKDMEAMKRQIASLNEMLQAEYNNEYALNLQVTDLTETNQFLQESVNEKTQTLSEVGNAMTLSAIPSYYPVKGTSIIVDFDNINEEDSALFSSEYPALYFSCGASARLVSTGSGRVESIEGDSEYGYLIVINHENGYKSEYYIKGTALVEPGDQVTQGCVLMHLEEDNTILRYRIKYNEEYIYPSEVMEISG